MPLKLGCPGAPKCMHVFNYVPGLRAHIPNCRHAQSKSAFPKRKEMETIMVILDFVNDKQKGNITIARNEPPGVRWEQPYFLRS